MREQRVKLNKVIFKDFRGLILSNEYDKGLFYQIKRKRKKNKRIIEIWLLHSKNVHLTTGVMDSLPYPQHNYKRIPIPPPERRELELRIIGIAEFNCEIGTHPKKYIILTIKHSGLDGYEN